jgi:hypothetical protein
MTLRCGLVALRKNAAAPRLITEALLHLAMIRQLSRQPVHLGDGEA